MIYDKRYYKCVLCGEKIYINNFRLKSLGISETMRGYDVGFICEKCNDHIEKGNLFERKSTK